MFYSMMYSAHFILQLYGRKEGRKEMFYLMMHSEHFILQLYGKKERRKCFI